MSEEHREHPLPWAAEGADSPEASSALPPSKDEGEMGAKDERDSERAESGQTQPDAAGQATQPLAAGQAAEPTAARQASPANDQPWQPGSSTQPWQTDSSAGETGGGAGDGGFADAASTPPTDFVYAPAADLFAIPSEPVAGETPQSGPPAEGQPSGEVPAGVPSGVGGEAPVASVVAGQTSREGEELQVEEVHESALIAAVLARRSDPRSRPHDPAGTRPKFDPGTLVSKRAQENPVLSTATEIIEDEEAIDDEHDDADSDLLPARRPSAGLGSPVAAAPPLPYAPRFQFVKGALGAIAALAVIGLVLLLTGGSSKNTGSHNTWSSWAPSSNGPDPAVQIADHVAPEYRLDNGKQLVTIRGGPPAYNGQSLVLALLQSGQQPTELNGNAVLYQLCGTGKNCAIKDGTPSVERGLLLRREALELALYTFHYLSGVNEVVVTIPPSPTTSTSDAGQATSESVINRALYFKPSNVSGELSHSLDHTLPAPTPDVSGMNASPNASLVANVTGNALYDFSIVQGDSTYVLVLTPPGIGG